MNSDTPVNDAVSPEAACAAADMPPTPPTPQWLRLQRLFRHTLKAGEVNPLLLIVPQYRQKDDA